MKRSLAAVLVGWSVCWTALASTFTIDNTATTNTTIWPFGAPETATYGQTFTTNGADTFLEDFSLYLDDRYAGSGELKFRGYLATWTGTRAGSIIYTSSDRATINGLEGFTFSVGVDLLPNTKYVAFLSTSELAAQATSQFRMPASYAATDTIPDGEFVFLNNGIDFSALTTVDWERDPFGSEDRIGDARLVANFNRGSQAQEPSVLALLSLGVIAIGASRRRKR